MPRYLSVILFLLTLIFPMHAYNAVDALFEMPDDMFPMLPHSHRIELCRIINSYTDGYANDSLPLLNEGFVRIERLADDKSEITISITDVLTVSIFYIDSRMYLIQTYCAPICSSIVKSYTEHWSDETEVYPPEDYLFPLAKYIDGEIVWSEQYEPNLIER